MIKVAILANIPCWTIPGLEHLRHGRHYATWLESLIPQFSSIEDLDIHWITFSKEVEADLTHEALGQTFHVLNRGSLALQTITAYLTETLRIKNKLKKLQPDIIHAWGSEEGYGLAAGISGHKNKIFTLQGCLTEYRKLVGGNLLFHIQSLYEKFTIRRYSHATAESPRAAELLKEIKPEIDVELVDYGVAQTFHDSVWNPAKNPEVIFVGAITGRKGIQDYIRIAKREELKHVLFKIAGDGDLIEALKSESTDNVAWLGKLDHSSLIRSMLTAWAVVVPTYADTGPSVIKEARVIGLPVITTHAAGASHYIKDGKSGYIGKPGDHDYLAQSVATITDSIENAQEMGNYQQTQAKRSLHPAVTAHKFWEIYKKHMNQCDE